MSAAEPMPPLHATPRWLDASLKGVPATATPCRPADVAGQGWRVLQGDLPWPIALLREDALAHNLAWMAGFCRRHHIDLAPHGKTTLSPELYRRQLEAGAWGITLATVGQIPVALQAGVARLLIANQVLAPADLAGLQHWHRQVPGLRTCFLVDSAAQVEQIETWHAAHGGARFDVLLEVGIAGQRTGTRDAGSALALAGRIAASPALRLVGVECYEGGLARCDHAHDGAATAALLARVHALVASAFAHGLFGDETATDEVIITAGGSALFDLVAPALHPPADSPLTPAQRERLRPVLRSGCYLTHDHGNYQRYVAAINLRLNEHTTLRPALEVWTMVQSVPEPGLALLTAGKRDLSHDIDLPTPIARAALGAQAPGGAPAHWRITALNDQHAYLRFDPAEPAPPRVGELVGLGISHPCTTFDKWRWMPVVDADYRVVDAITTGF